MTILIAFWSQFEDPSLPPSQVYWTNGCRATRGDYWLHLKYTSVTFTGPDGSLYQLFLPGLYGATFYDTVDRVWKVRPDGEAFALIANDPLAKDDVIVEELALSPIAYRPKIERSVQRIR